MLALYHGPWRDKDPRWMTAFVTKVHGSRSVYMYMYVRVYECLHVPHNLLTLPFGGWVLSYVNHVMP